MTVDEVAIDNHTRFSLYMLGLLIAYLVFGKVYEALLCKVGRKVLNHLLSPRMLARPIPIGAGQKQ